jgi:SAM-dependent methyltransferase
MSKSPEFAAAADPPARRAACQLAYREHARSYDRQTGAFGRYRQAVVEVLPVRWGQVVLDVGSGTGLCSGLLRDKVGPQGSVVGIEASPEMAAVAREHIAAEGWRNVTVVQSPPRMPRSRSPRMPPFSAPSTTSCSPRTRCGTSSASSVRGHGWPLVAGSGLRGGWWE